MYTSYIDSSLSLLFCHLQKENKMTTNTLFYEASVYTRTVSYKNFKGEERSVELYFALDPLELMSIIANFQPTKRSKSGNPAKRNQEAELELTDEQQLRFFRDLCIKSAGEASNDGEAWESFPDFDTTLAGKAFLTKLASSEDDRKEFAEKVILNPFKAFVNFAKQDPTNSAAEIQQFEKMAQQMENIFAPAPSNESYEEKKARLAAELASLEKTAQNTDDE